MCNTKKILALFFYCYLAYSFNSFAKQEDLVFELSLINYVTKRFIIKKTSRDLYISLYCEQPSNDQISSLLWV